MAGKAVTVALNLSCYNKIRQHFFLAKLSDAQFRRWTFYVPNLTATWVDPNDVSSTVDSDVELNSSNSIHSYAVKKNGLQCLAVKRNYCHLCIRFGTWKVRRLTQSRSMVEIPKWATRNWSTQIRHVGLNWRDLFGTWEVGRLNWAWVHSHYKQCFWPIGTHVNTSFFYTPTSVIKQQQQKYIAL